MGLGTSSSASLFTDSTVVIPADVTIAGLVLNIRDNPLTAGQTVAATIFTSPCGWTDPVSTGVAVTVTGPNAADDPNCFASAAGNFAVSQGSLLSVQIATGTGVGALSRGVAVTVFLATP